MSDLLVKQQLFVKDVGLLIAYAYSNGYTLTFGETYRTPEQAKLNAISGSGISNSLHTLRLAIDLNLFKDGKYLHDTIEYRELGEYWKSLGPEHSWGGDWKTDGNHFSIEHNGVR